MNNWLGFKVPSLRFLHSWAVANLAVNVLLVVTGGAVRVTNSGLGCPTWPQCGSGSYTPHEAMGIHGVIEFGNRMLTYVLLVFAVGTWLAAMRYRPVDRVARRLATFIALGIPLQGVIGGITVLTKLNPWVVSLHFLLTILIISLATWLVYRTRPNASPAPTIPDASPVGRIGVALTWAAYVVTWATIYLGTVVTGSGPHAGDMEAKRNGFDPANLTQLHVDSVWLLVGLGTALVLLAKIANLHWQRATLIFAGTLLTQGVIGYVQYFTALPAALVIVHMFGASLLMVGATWLVVSANRAQVTNQLG